MVRITPIYWRHEVKGHFFCHASHAVAAQQNKMLRRLAELILFVRGPLQGWHGSDNRRYIVFRLSDSIMDGFVSFKYPLLAGAAYPPFAYLKRISTTVLIGNLSHGVCIIRS